MDIMNKSELSGRDFERILKKSGFTRPDYIKFLADKHKIERTLSWAHWLVIHHRDDKKVPLQWVVLLKDLVGEKDFEKWAKGGKESATVSLSDTSKMIFRAYSIEEYAQLRKEGRLPKTNLDAALKKIRTKWTIKMTDEEFLTLVENGS
jgi:hypothetical protein